MAQQTDRAAAAAALLSTATTCSVKPVDFGLPRGVGFVCEEDVKAGGVFLEVPAKSAFTSDWASSEVRKELNLKEGEWTEVTNQDYFCLWLLLERERGASSSYSHFVQELPEDRCEMCAAYWPEELLATLGGCEAKVRLEELREHISEAYARVETAVKASSEEVQKRLGTCLSADSYSWARCVLNSRQFQGSWNKDAKSAGMLLPLGDMFNHDSDLPLGDCLVRGSGAEPTVQFVALRDFSKGEEALISYGRDGNSHLLERGFAVENNPHDSVDLVLGVECSKEKCPHLLSAIPVSATEGDDCMWRDQPTPSSPQAEARLRLRRSNPLPEALLMLVRLECLENSDLASGRCVKSDRKIAPFGEDCERVMLSKLLAVAEAMLARLGAAQPLPESEEEPAKSRRRMLVHAFEGERAVLMLFAEAVHRRLVNLLVAMEEGKADELTNGTYWFYRIQEAKPLLAEAKQSGDFAEAFNRLQSLPLGKGSSPAYQEARHAWAASKVFLWLHDVARSKVAEASADEELAAWAESPGPAGEYLKLYFEKMALWGRYLVGQFACSGGFDVSEMNIMQMESVSIRNQRAWSVPTPEALRLIADQGPLIEVGAGNGLWASLLKDNFDCDILCFDTPKWDARFGAEDEPGVDQMMGDRLKIVQFGGPEKIEENSERTLVLMWPDYKGAGRFASSCLKEYKGEKLILVGEWFGSTYGLVRQWGQSFSKDFVESVEEDFTLETTLKLPCWPMAADCVMLWRRRIVEVA
mmetsp:Transcript_28570/g.62140  ORF Transcript_28570/g.62140 Transcript_28570/m.62140 type:complete len:754 (+) Transcript_28570:44-2305(+)